MRGQCAHDVPSMPLQCTHDGRSLTELLELSSKAKGVSGLPLRTNAKPLLGLIFMF